MFTETENKNLVFSVPYIDNIEDIPDIRTLNLKYNRTTVYLHRNCVLNGKIPECKHQRDVNPRKKKMREYLIGKPNKEMIVCIALRQYEENEKLKYEILNGNTRIAVMNDAITNKYSSVFIPEYFEATVHYLPTEDDADKAYVAYDNKEAVETQAQRMKGKAKSDDIVFTTRLKSGSYMRALQTAHEYVKKENGRKKDVDELFDEWVEILKYVDETNVGNLKQSVSLAAAFIFFGKFIFDDKKENIPDRAVEFFVRLSKSDSDGGSYQSGICPINHIVRQFDTQKIKTHITKEGIYQVLLALEKYIKQEKPRKFKTSKNLDKIDHYIQNCHNFILRS